MKLEQLFWPVEPAYQNNVPIIFLFLQTVRRTEEDEQFGNKRFLIFREIEVKEKRLTENRSLLRT